MNLSMKTLFCSLIAVLLFVSCSREVSFSEGLTFPSTKTAKADIIIPSDSLLLAMPMQMAVLDDSLLIIKDFASSGNYFHIYTVKGKKLASFGAKGRGAGEIIFPETFFIDSVDRLLVKDRKRNVVLSYDIYAVLRGDTDYFTKSEIVNDEQALFITPLGDDRYLNIEMSVSSRFRLFRGQRELFSYKSKPEFMDEESLLYVNFILCRGLSNHAIKPDATQFVNGGEIGAVLEVFDITDSSIESNSFNPIYKPLYTVSDNFPSQSLSTRRGFINIAATNDLIYTILDHTPKTEEKKPVKDISVFNWKAEPELLIKTEYELFSFAVSEEGQIYATCKDENQNLCVVKLNL